MEEENQIPTTKAGEILYSLAIEAMYDKHFDRVTKFLESARPDQIPGKLSMVVNTVLSEIQEQKKEVPLDVIAEVGFKLVIALMDDLAADGHIEPMSDELREQTLGSLIADYALMNPDKVSKEEFNDFMQQLAGGQPQAAPDQGSEPMPPQQGLLNQGVPQ